MKPPANKPTSKIATIKKAERGLRFGGGGEEKEKVLVMIPKKP
jgi:hypothetical protein